MNQQGSHIIYNGVLYPWDTKIITANSRAFRYGDGLFETMRIRDGSILLRSRHFQRLFSGIEFLQFSKSEILNKDHLIDQISLLLRNNKQEKSARIRLQVFRGDSSFFDINDQQPNYVIQSWDHPRPFELNEQKVTAGIFRDVCKSPDKYSNIKSCNFLLYVLAGIHAKTKGWDEALITNTNHRIAESTVANVFWIKNGQIFTPPLSEGCVAGIMREYLLEILKKEINICEKELNEEILSGADEIFLTNAINGIRSVDAIGSKVYLRKDTEEIFEKCVKKIGD